MTEGQPIPMKCKEDCKFLERYGFRPCEDGISFGMLACTNTMFKICEIIRGGKKYKTWVAGATFYRRSANKPDSENWSDWSIVGTLKDGNFIPVVKK